MGRGDLPRNRWKKDRRRKHKEREQRRADAAREAHGKAAKATT